MHIYVVLLGLVMWVLASDELWPAMLYMGLVHIQ